MKATGVTRPIDELGRVCLPKELRDNLSMNTNDRVEIFVDGDNIILRKYQPTCGVCHESGELVESLAKHGIKVCKKCLAEANK